MNRICCATSSTVTMRHSETSDSNPYGFASCSMPKRRRLFGDYTLLSIPCTTPGRMALTRMLEGPSSIAQVCVIPITPNFVAV